ncbi:MAG TPA: 23S rRNA pseudouridine(955/2504/2580) synthase RluC [Acidiferrobacteraceae bacterium]|nr:23S rRNA pseudouridine(955/2504/2580) synthase RluC [Acidiferrobacteraceae bacterium]
MSKISEKLQVKWVEVDAQHSGQRLDNYLLAALKGVPKSHIYRIVRTGEVRINKGRVRPDYRLREGDVVRVPPIRTAAREDFSHLPSFELEPRVVYEDEFLLVMDKPSGIPVHGGSGYSLGIIEDLRRSRPQQTYLELVHRLDRETSGCLLIAKSRGALLSLHASLRNHAEKGIRRTYIALVRGPWKGAKQRRVDANLVKNVVRSGERMVEVSEEGRPSSSGFRLTKQLDHCALVEIELYTGRTHQARVHAVHIGHPIAGDEKYGDRVFNKQCRQQGLNRLFLHASRLQFVHPDSGKVKIIETPLSEDLQNYTHRRRLS